MRNIAAMERDIREKKDAAAALFAKTSLACQEYVEKDADGKVLAQGRLMTAEEKGAIQALVDQAMALKADIATAQGTESLQAAINALTGGMSAQDAYDTRRHGIKSLGQQWVESEGGRFFVEKRHQGSRNWNSPVAELTLPDRFATTITTGSGSAGPLVVTDYRPGLTPLQFKKTTIKDLLASGTTTSNSITYMKEKTFTNGAATVAEGATKPESTLVFEQASDPVQKIAHWIPVTEEALEDVPTIRSIIDARLRLGLELTEEDQLLNGDGVAPNLLGLMNRVGLAAAHARVDPQTNAEAIYVQALKIFQTAYVMPTGVVMNPVNWQSTVLMKDSTGAYMGMGPFDGGLTSQTIWGLPVDVTPSIVANTALVGAFDSQAQVFMRGGVRVEASNSHQDYFIKNLVAIRAEQREALVVYRPGAFGKVTGLT
jgi:HK97 family phage major capsid protein